MFSEMIFRSNSYARFILFSDGFKNVFSTFSGGIQYTFSMFSVYHFLTKTLKLSEHFQKSLSSSDITTAQYSGKTENKRWFQASGTYVRGDTRAVAW